MKVSSSAQPEHHLQSSNGSLKIENTALHGRRVAWIVAALYLVLHLPFLAPSLEDIDSINFALGLRAFNPALHQPHPPGYPVYMALGHASLAIVGRLTSMSRVSAEAWSLAVWSAIGGAACIIAAWFLFAALAERSGQPPTSNSRLPGSPDAAASSSSGAGSWKVGVDAYAAHRAVIWRTHLHPSL